MDEMLICKLCDKDKIKTRLCKSKNISLIRIRESYRDTTAQIIQNILNNII